jgi:hypothetical protein
MSTGKDAVNYLKGQHQEIKSLFPGEWRTRTPIAQSSRGGTRRPSPKKRGFWVPPHAALAVLAVPGVYQHPASAGSRGGVDILVRTCESSTDESHTNDGLAFGHFLGRRHDGARLLLVERVDASARWHPG